MLIINKMKSKTLKAVSYTAEVDWGKLIDNAWRGGFLSGLVFGVIMASLIYLSINKL